MRQYLCTVEEVEENKQRTKRRRIDPVISEANTAGRSGLEQQQWLNQREQQPRSILNTRRGKNLRLDDSSGQVAKYLQKQIERSNQLLAQMEVDNRVTEEYYEESDDDFEEDLDDSYFDVQGNEEEYFSEVVDNKRVESENNVTLDGYGKPNSEMLEIMARRQQKLAQRKGQGQKIVNQSKIDAPEMSSLAATIIGQATAHMHSEPMEVDIVPKGRRSIREKLDSSVSVGDNKLTPAMQEILARKQQVSKQGPTRKLNQTVSSTTELVSNIHSNSQLAERGTRLGRKSIRDSKSGVGTEVTTTTQISQQMEDALKKPRSRSLQPANTVNVTNKELSSLNESENKVKSVIEDVGKLTPAMQEILARKQQKLASKQGQNKKVDGTISSTTENIAGVKLEPLSPKMTLEYSKTIETETKTTRYSRSTTENKDEPVSTMQEVQIQKEQQKVVSKPRKSRKLLPLDQTVTSTVETSLSKLVPAQSHIEPEKKSRRKTMSKTENKEEPVSTVQEVQIQNEQQKVVSRPRKSRKQPEPNASGAGDSLYYKPPEDDKELKNKQNQSDPVVSENTGKLTPAMKAILARKQQKESASKQGANKKLSVTVTSTAESVLSGPTDQTQLSNKKPTVNETKGVGRNTRISQVEKSTLEVADTVTKEKLQTTNEPVTKGKGKKKQVPVVSSTTKVEEPPVHIESKTISARGTRRTIAALTEDMNTTENVENPTPAMRALLAKKQQCALQKSTKKKK